MKEKVIKKKPSPFKKGDYIGIIDKHSKPIHLGDTVKITIGKPNNGYLVIFEAGAFCFTGGMVGTCSFIKFRDELLEGRITGNKITTPFNLFLEVVSNKPDESIAIEPNGTGANYNQPRASGGIQ